MDIDELLNRYFEGETSSEEERELRAFFTSGNVPDRLAVYTPMFTYLEEDVYFTIRVVFGIRYRRQFLAAFGA